jgi:hypothetical protein
MPDISMCHGELEGETCSLREKCRRHSARPDPLRQAYMVPPVIGEECEYYWPVKSVAKEKGNR